MAPKKTANPVKHVPCCDAAKTGWCMPSSDWADVLPDLLPLVATGLSDDEIQCCRVVCKRWRLGFSLAVHSLCIKQNVWAKQWPAISTAFPLCRRLDIRNVQILPEHVPVLAQLSSVQVLQHSDFQCPGSPEEYVAQLTAWTTALLEQAPHMRVLAEVHTFYPGQVLTDRAAQQLIALPPNVSITRLLLTRLGGTITRAAFAAVCQLTGLSSLSATCRLALGNKNFEQLAGLTLLQDLDIGPLNDVDDAGFQALRPLTNLQALELAGMPLVTDEGFGSIIPSLASVTSLSLIKCVRLTDASLTRLSSLQQLSQLFFSDNGQGRPEGFTAAGLDQLLRNAPALGSVNFRGCKYLSMADRARVCCNLFTGRRLRRISLFR